MTYDPGMDPPPDTWQSPEINPTFPEVGQAPPVDENVDNPYGSVHFADADEMHHETIDALRMQSAGLARLLRTLTDVGKATLRVDAGQTISRSMRLRVRWLIISRATAGTAVLSIGTATYPFDVQAAPVRVDFPLVIENGVDIGYTGDGRIYLIADPE